MTFPSFGAGEVLTATDMNAVGLWLIGSTTFSNTATPFINGCFSSEYQNYKVQIVTQASSPCDLYVRLRSGVNTPDTGAVYDRFGWYLTGGGTFSNMFSSNTTAMGIIDVTNSGNNQTTLEMEIAAVNQAVPTIVRCRGWGSNSGGSYYPDFRVETNTQYTGIEFNSLSTPTFTGTMRVYGYRN
jgi:hypothetical protein